MKAHTLTQRLETLEQNQHALAVLPERMTSLEDRMAGIEKELANSRIEVRQGLANLGAELRSEIKTSADESRRFTRVLYEDLVERIKWLGEGFNGSPRKNNGGKKRR